MSEPPAERWRSWPRRGDHIDAPDDASMEERLAAMWALTCETYGIDPENPPPLRKDIVRVGRLHDKEEG
jgi:hypothetical protein